MQDDLSAKFAALGHPVRREMLKALSQGSATVGELAEPHKMSAPAISNHLKVLEAAGLIERTVEAQHRRVSLCMNQFSELETWVSELRGTSGRGFDRLEERLMSIRKRLGRQVEEAPDTSAQRARADRRRSAKPSKPELVKSEPASSDPETKGPRLTRLNSIGNAAVGHDFDNQFVRKRSQR